MMGNHAGDRSTRSIWRNLHRRVSGIQNRSTETIRVTSRGARFRKAADVLAQPEAKEKLRAMEKLTGAVRTTTRAKEEA